MIKLAHKLFIPSRRGPQLRLGWALPELGRRGILDGAAYPTVFHTEDPADKVIAVGRHAVFAASPEIVSRLERPRWVEAPLPDSLFQVDRIREATAPLGQFEVSIYLFPNGEESPSSINRRSRARNPMLLDDPHSLGQLHRLLHLLDPLDHLEVLLQMEYHGQNVPSGLAPNAIVLGL